MKLHLISIFISVCVSSLLTVFPTCLFAYSWPVFSPPNKALLLDTNKIDMSHCPPGQGKLKQNSSINIHEHLCRTFCLETWNWTAISDNSCHDLASEFEFQKYDFVYYPKNTGTTSYSEITASYGKKNSDKPAFKFVFRSAPGEHWYCIQQDPELHTIICANDI
jgi:hypothetical protein